MAQKRSVGPGSIQTKAQGIISGFTTHPLDNVTTLVVDGVTYTQLELSARLTALEAIYAVANKAEREWMIALQAREEIAKDATKLVHSLTQLLKAMLGRFNPNLVYFGIEPDKAPTALTSEQSVEKKKRNKATRKARGTMGPKQKAKIKGTVPVTNTP